MARLSQAEICKRSKAKRTADSMKRALWKAYSDGEMMAHASLVVFTRGQWNGIRAAIRRLKVLA